MIGTIILAAGKGKRLGKGVKGLVKVDGEPLLMKMIEKSGDHVIALTSKVTHDPIVQYLNDNKLDYVKPVEMPVEQNPLDAEESNPIGNGAVFETVAGSEVYQDWIAGGITHISVVAIDNPLADPLDEKMVGGDLVIKALEKKGPDEKMGSVVQEGKRLKIIEYFELSEEERKKYTLGYAGMFVCSTQFFEKAANLELPWHVVGRGAAPHREKLLIDAFPIAESPKVVIQEREECFCPIKEESDIALAEQLLYNKRQSKKG